MCFFGIPGPTYMQFLESSEGTPRQTCFYPGSQPPLKKMVVPF